MAFLGIDLGTSGLRALLVDENGTALGSVARNYSTDHPQKGWSEQDPQLWIEALESAIFELSNNYSQFKSLVGIGVSGHMHGATLVDESGTPLRPCILWNDTRSYAEAERFDADPAFREISGNIVFPGFTAPKLEWVRKNEPEIFDQIHKVLLPAAFLNHYLTGEFTADMSDSSGTSWLDVGDRRWSGSLLRKGNMRLNQMPNLVEGCQAIGTLRPQIASKWGVRTNVIVAGGAGDNAATACGIGALAHGQGFVSLGTSGVVLAARDGFMPAAKAAVHTFCHAVPERWYQMGVMLAATDSLNWLSRITSDSPAQLTSKLEGQPIGYSTTRFLPYLSGERTPHNDAEIRGAFTGIGAESGKEDLTKAVLEGVSFGLKDSVEALKSTGAEFESLYAVGGGAASDYWLRLLASALEVPLNLPKDQECGAALGAARLAICAVTGADPNQIMRPPKIQKVIEPDLGAQSQLAERYLQFKAAYPLIKQAQ